MGRKRKGMLAIAIFALLIALALLVGYGYDVTIDISGVRKEGTNLVVSASIANEGLFPVWYVGSSSDKPSSFYYGVKGIDGAQAFGRCNKYVLSTKLYPVSRGTEASCKATIPLDGGDPARIRLELPYFLWKSHSLLHGPVWLRRLGTRRSTSGWHDVRRKSTTLP